MGKKDTKAKEYLADNERFADLCNVLLFNGEQVIGAESLVEKDSTEALSMLGSEDNEQTFQQKWRDLLKSAVIKQTQGIYIVLIGVESQSMVHYAMPVKNAIYDALNYGSQVKRIGKRHRKAADKSSRAEFLSGFHKEDRLIPIITITVYWGADDWDAPRTLHEMFGDLDRRLKSYIPDYRINLLAPKEIEDFNKFQTELGNVLEAIKVSDDQASMDRLFQSNKKFSAMSNESVEAINTFIGTNIPVNQKEGVTDMCKAWEDQKNEGIAEGRAQARLDAIRNMVELGISKENILIKYTKEEYERAQQMMAVGF